MLFDNVLFWLVPIVAVALWIPQNCQHEGMHALAARHWGAKITEFVFWPSKKAGYFTWAFVRWTGGSYDDTARGLISIAPQFANTVILCLILGMRWRFPDMPPVAASILAAWFLTNFVDGAYNLSTYYRKVPESPRSDGWSFQSRLQLSPATCRLATVAWHLWFGFHLFLPTALF
jgi:hypothetical protein